MPGGGYPVRPITSGGGLAPAFSFSGNQGDRGYGPGLVAPFSPYGNYEGVMRTRPRLSFPPSPTPNVALGVGQGQAAWWGNQGDKGYGSGLTSPLSTSGMYEGIMRTRPRLSFPPSDLMPGRGYPAGAVTSGMLPPIMEYAVSPHLGGGQGGFAGPNFLAGGRMAIGGGPASFSNAPYGLNYPAVPPSGWAVSGHRGGGEGGPAGPRWFGRSSDIGHTGGSWGGRFGTLPPIPGPDYAISGHRGSGEGGPAGPYSFGGRTDIGPISQLFERLGVLPPIPGPDYVSSGHRGSGEGGLAGPYSRGGRSDVGPTGGAWGRYGALPPIPGPDYVSSGHLGGAQPGPGTTSAWSSGRTMEYGNLPPIPGPEYMWGHSGRSDTRHTMGVGGREGFGISGSLINSRSFMGAPDLMRRFGSGAYTRYHIASNEGFAGPTGPGDAAGGFMMPPGLDFSKLGTMDLPPTGAGQLGSKGGSIDYTGGGVGSLAGGMGPAGLPGAKAYDPRSWFQRLKDRIYGAGAASVGALNYTAADRLQVAEETGKSLIDISAILHRMEQQGGAPGYPPFSGGGYGTPGGGGPTFRPGKTPGRYTSRGGRQYMGGDTPAPSGVGGALYDPITGTALGGGLGAARPGHVHQGDDIEAPEGSPIYAIRDGTIRSHNAHGTYQGDAATRIYFDDGTSAYYMHHHLDPELAARLAKGEHPRIKGGQVLGTSGTAAGVGHLHFQLYDASGRIISPRAYFGWNRSNLPKGGQTAITSPTQLQPVPIDKDKLPLVSPGPVPPEHERGRIRPQVGIATWYQPGMSRDAGGGTTASGEAYNRNEWTAAVLQSRRGDFGGVTSRSGPGYALVESRDGKKAVIKINDVYGLSQEGTGRIIDLNRRSADFFGRGLIPGMKVTALPGYNGPVGPLEEGQALSYEVRLLIVIVKTRLLSMRLHGN